MAQKTRRKLALLGPIRVESENSIPRFRTQRTQALLGYLVVAQRPLARNHLAALFWPDDDATTARTHLRRDLYNLNRILPGCWQMEQTAVAFTPDAHTAVDLYEIERLIADEAWTEASAWLGGQFLEGLDLVHNLEFETWLSGERERWQQRAEQILLTVAQQLWQTGDAPAAQQALIRLIQLIPWHELAHQRLIRLLARQGHFAAALKQYQTCCDLLQEELGITPSVTTDSLVQQIKTATAYPAQPLPPRLTPFIGREAEQRMVQQHVLDPTCHLLTIVGLGGMGKSRLALEMAHTFAKPPHRRFLHGIVFVSLSGVEAEEVVATISGAMGIRLQGQQAGADQLLTHLRQRELLLVLDNYEHLLPQTALVERILVEAPEITLLVTSRERLQLQQEWVCHLTGLAYPTHLDDAVGAYPAVQLFADGARRITQQFVVANHAADVVEISRLVEGMPLALLLASSWIETQSPAEIAAQIQHNLDFLQAQYRNVDPRQRSMRAVFEATWARLAERQKTVLASLSVFRGGFTAVAAATVIEANASELTFFVSRGLLGQVDGQYTIHELLRQFAAEKLAVQPTSERTIQQRHADYYLGLWAASEKALFGEDVLSALETLTAARTNLITAWHWSVAHRNEANIRQVVRGLGRFFRLRGPLQEGGQLLQTAVTHLRPFLHDSASPFNQETFIVLLLEWSHFLLDERNFEKVAETAVEALNLAQAAQNKALISAAHLLWGQALYNLRQNKKALHQLEKAIALAEESQSRYVLARSLRQLGIVYLIGEHDFARGVPFLEQALRISEEINDIETEARSRNALGIAFITRDYNRALNYLQTAVHLYRQLQDSWGEGIVLINLAHMAITIGDFIQAQRYCEETVSLKRELGDRQGEGIALINLALIAHQTGENERALWWTDQALALTPALKDNVVAAYAYLFRGHALHELGQHKEALAAYKTALIYWQQMSEAALLLETMAGMARAHWAMGEQEKAQVHTEAILDELGLADLNNAEEPVRIYLTCFQVLDAISDKRAFRILADGHAFLLERAAHMEDEFSRQAFLDNIQTHRQLRQSYERLNNADGR